MKLTSNKIKFILYLLTIILGGGVGISAIFALVIPLAENEFTATLFVLIFPAISLIYFIHLFIAFKYKEYRKFIYSCRNFYCIHHIYTLDYTIPYKLALKSILKGAFSLLYSNIIKNNNLPFVDSPYNKYNCTEWS
ncbi:hypothetical protein CN357_04580 [Bacillus cereus]|uniref:Uncharacterized protein n=1 Tax=Bacillus cereus TaxID=1396 RepID=A0A9X6W1P3_BACCE|nr:hypothetical protein CN357_04580 [Bacillus cereus]PFQ37826.1 hypothetical protein COK33_14790 [Bacillus cereus]PGB13226.1 hypothetical protein COM09_15855 [Bacillus toyonensis]